MVTTILSAGESACGSLWTLGAPRGSAVVCVDPGRLPSSLGLCTESTNSVKGSFASAKESSYLCKGVNVRLERWLAGSRKRGEKWVN